MKYNTRYFYTIFGSVIGVWSLKYFYFYLQGKNELDFKYPDYAQIGALCGVYLANFFVSLNIRNIIISASVGATYGLFYKILMTYIVYKNKRNAEKIGIQF
jgi:hypothetical protein